MNVHVRLKVADSKVLVRPKVAEMKVFGRTFRLFRSRCGFKGRVFIPVLKPVERSYLNDLF